MTNQIREFCYGYDDDDDDDDDDNDDDNNNNHHHPEDLRLINYL